MASKFRQRDIIGILQNGTHLIWFHLFTRIFGMLANDAGRAHQIHAPPNSNPFKTVSVHYFNSPEKSPTMKREREIEMVNQQTHGMAGRLEHLIT